MSLQNIKTIIFDLGGVIIDLDVAATAHAFAALMHKPVDHVWKVMGSESVFIAYEKGLVSSDDFREEIRKIAAANLTDAQIDTAWNAMLGAIPKNRIDLLVTLRAQYQVMILSNTNEIHEKAFHRILDEVTGKPHLSYFADEVYFSHDLKMRKPDAEIYQHVLSQNKLVPKETLFLDDKLENLEGAKACGIATMQIHFPDQIFTLVK